jgi:hypothetical protein
MNGPMYTQDQLKIGSGATPTFGRTNPVGTGSSVPTTGYSKNYGYDDRLHVLLPPYLFDIVTSAWQLSRETLCTASAAATDPTSCSYTGT